MVNSEQAIEYTTDFGNTRLVAKSSLNVSYALCPDALGLFLPAHLLPEQLLPLLIHSFILLLLPWLNGG
jgi:hypothetical protein